jgi:CHASE3 domain sensor protein
MSEKNKRESLIKTKVFISYAVFVVLIISILFFTFNSFHRLTQSTDTLASPNPRINILHEIIISIYHAESNIRAYSLIGAESHLDAYFEELASINEKVDSLYRLSADDEFYKHHIDTINYQLLEKTRLLERLIEIKRQDHNSLFYERALTDILQAAEDETRVKEITHTIVEDIPDQEIAEILPEEVTREKENFFSRLRNLFREGHRKDKLRQMR